MYKPPPNIRFENERLPVTYGARGLLAAASVPGEPYFKRGVHEVLREAVGLLKEPFYCGKPHPVRLNPRQRTVLLLLLEGRERDEIARLLHISPHTARDHIKAVYRRLCAAARKWGETGGFKIGALEGGGKWSFPPPWVFETAV